MDRQVWGKVGETGSAFGKSNLMESMGYIPMQEEAPSIDHVAQEDGTWLIPPEALEANYQRDLATLDPLLAHVMRHDFNGEIEAKARAELKYSIAQAEVLEKYNKGSTVYVTETGTHYHKDINCSSLSTSDLLLINLSKGLKEYSPCSKCVNNN